MGRRLIIYTYGRSAWGAAAEGPEGIMELKVEKISRSFCVTAGTSVLGKFRTESAAQESLKSDRAMYEFWAGSSGVSIQNTPARVVVL